MADQIPVAEMNQAIEAARRAHLASIRGFERNSTSIMKALSSSAEEFSKSTSRMGDIALLRTIENSLAGSKNMGMQAIGVSMKLVTSLIDVALSFQDQFNALRKETMLTAASMGMAGRELDNYVAVGISAESDLRSELHVELQTWDAYLKAYRNFAVAAEDMNIQVMREGKDQTESVTHGLFVLSSRFQLDVVKTSEAFWGTLTKAGDVGTDANKNAERMLQAWRSVAAGATVVGSSAVKAFTLISDIASGTEQEVSSGSDRILGMSDMYDKLFAILKKNHQQGLIEDYFRAIEQGLRQMSISNASLFSGVMFGGGPTHTRNAFAGAMDFKAMIRTLKNPETQQRVGPYDILKVAIEQIKKMTGTGRIIIEEDLRNNISPLRRDELAQKFYFQQSLISQLAPGLIRGESWRFAATLRAIDEGRQVSLKDAKEALTALYGSEEADAKQIEDSKVTTLREMSDMLFAWSNRVLFGKDLIVDPEVSIRHAREQFTLQYGDKVSFIARNRTMGADASRADREREDKDLGDKWERLRTESGKAALYHPNDFLSKFNEQRVDILKRKGDELMRAIIPAIKAGKIKRFRELADPKTPLERKAAIVQDVIAEKYQTALARAKTDEERRAVQLWGDQVSQQLMNPYIRSEITSAFADIDNKTVNPSIAPSRQSWNMISPVDPYEIKRTGFVDYDLNAKIAAAVGNESKASQLRQAGTQGAAPPGAYNGMLNISEGDIRKLHEGEMIIPRNQADIIRAMGGPLAFLELVSQNRGRPIITQQTRVFNEDATHFMRQVVGSMHALEGGIKNTRNILLNASPVSDAFGAEYAVDCLLRTIDEFTRNLGDISNPTMSRAAQGLTATEGQMTTWDAIKEFLFGKRAAEEVKKAGGVPAVKPPAPIPELLKLPESTVKAIGGQMTADQIMAFKFNIAYNESKNTYDAMNRQTSASGKYQFLRPTARGLWQQNRDAFADLGITERDFSTVENYRRLMTDPIKGKAVQERFMNTAVTDYAKSLGRAGLPINQETMAVMHYLGHRGINMLRKYGSSFLNSGFNPTAGTGIANTTVGKYIGTMRAMGTEAFAKAREEGTLLDSRDLIAWNTAKIARSAKEFASAAFGAFGKSADRDGRTPDKSYQIMPTLELASALLSPPSSPPPPSVQITPDAEIRRDFHSVTVPVTSRDGLYTGATCTINFETKTITEIMDKPGYLIS